MKTSCLIFLLYLVNLSVFPMESTPKQSATNNKELLQAIKKAKDWLNRQLVPNAVVPNPTRPNFILSYQHDKSNKSYKYIFSKSSLYDNALAIIAFTMIGSYQEAEAIINALLKESPQGIFYFNYNTHNAWPHAKDKSGAIIRNGATAWLGYAIAYHLKLRVLKTKKFKKLPKYKEFIKLLEQIIQGMLKDKILNRKDPRFGLIKGGHGVYKYEYDEKKNQVNEVFYDRPIPWVSIEHCMDFYFLLKEAVDLGLTHYKNELKTYQTKLIPLFWNANTKQFNRGYGAKGKDEVEALDAASWGAIYLYSVGDIEKSLLALSKTKAYQNWQDSAKGHRPYINVRVYEEYKINQYFYKKDPNTSWSNIPISWYEGTFGVLLADLKIKGNTSENKQSMEELLKKQNADGSFDYASVEIPYQFSNRPSVASTAWFIIAASSYMVPEIRNGFWP